MKFSVGDIVTDTDSPSGYLCYYKHFGKVIDKFDQYEEPFITVEWFAPVSKDIAPDLVGQWENFSSLETHLIRLVSVSEIAKLKLEGLL